MKLITAVVTEAHLEAVAHALNVLGVPAAAVFSVLTPSEAGRWEVYRGQPHPVDVLESVRLEIVIVDADTDDIVRAILSACECGPGWLWVTPVDLVSRFDTRSSPHRAPVSHHRRADEPEHPGG